MAANKIVHHQTGNTVDPRLRTPNGLMLPSELKAILGLIYKNTANISRNADIVQIKWFFRNNSPIINSLPKINVIIHITRSKVICRFRHSHLQELQSQRYRSCRRRRQGCWLMSCPHRPRSRASPIPKTCPRLPLIRNSIPRSTCLSWPWFRKDMFCNRCRWIFDVNPQNLCHASCKSTSQL